METTHRDYNTISPSAKSVLLLKGLTDIPFARETAALISSPQPYHPDFNNIEVAFWSIVIHLESRYRSINQLLTELPIKNILELSSGFSFRGLETIKQEGYHYIDTDLPDLVATKKDLITSLQDNTLHTSSILELLSLNALDEKEFTAVVDRFPPGEIIIVNEGLLPYLDDAEKEKLCHIIHKILALRGGYWITADIYIKNNTYNAAVLNNEEWKNFYTQHHMHENMFDSFDAAAAFFKKAGFTIDKEATTEYSRLSSLTHLTKNATAEQLSTLRQTDKTRATWQLKTGS
jgi:O-methyltransferase involved in polyketide biosynthesis